MTPYGASEAANELEGYLQSKKVFEAKDEEIKQVLRYAMVLVGLRADTISSISEEAKMVMLAFIRKNYHGHTLDEMKLAFLKAVSRELPLEEKEISCYENFSCEYIGRIMKAYRKWAGEYYRESGLDIKFAEVPLTLPPAKYSPVEWVDDVYQQFLQGKMNLEIIPERVYDIAVEELQLTLPRKKMWELLLQSRDHVLNAYIERKKKLNPEKKFGEYHELTEKIDKLEGLEPVDSCQDGYVNQYVKALALREYFYTLQASNILHVQKQKE